MADHPFQPLMSVWLTKIKQAIDWKRSEFQDDADECYRFFDGSYEWLYDMRQMRQGFIWSGTEEDFPKPSFCMTVNKTAELVQIFGPVLYHRNPTRTVTPRKVPEVPPDLVLALMGPQMMQNPMMQQQMIMMQQQLNVQVQTQRTTDNARSMLLGHYLNYTPEALDLKTESRWAIDEALIKGMGVMWPELYSPPGLQTKMVGSFFDTVDNLVLDPDARCLRDCKWIARKRVEPVWQVEDEFGLPRGTIPAHMESNDRQALIDVNDDMRYLRAQGRSNDLVVWWQVYSKMGTGARLAGVQKEMRDTLDGFGDFCYLCLSEGMEYPLNLPPQLLAQGDIQKFQDAIGWHTPFWADGEWPFTTFTFHERPGKLWPMSHLKPGLGELKFINWCYSFVASKIKTTCRDFIVMQKSLGEEIKSTILHGKDLELIEIERATGTITEAVQFLQHPTFNGDIWKVLEAIERNFERRVGLTELMYGTSSSQLRSAQEANIKASQLNVRPDDMAQKIEESCSAMSRKEAFMARWHLTGADVQMVMGDVGAQLWDKLVTPSDPKEILFGLEYRIEEGSAKKPNKDTQIANMTQAVQTLFQPLFQYASSTGIVDPVNALIKGWCEAMDIDPQQFLLMAPVQPPVGPGAPPGNAPPPKGPAGGQPGQTQPQQGPPAPPQNRG